MKTLPLLLASAFFVSAASAAPEPAAPAPKAKIAFDDLMLADGTVLKNATVTKVDPDGLRLEHSNGISKVKFEDLPKNVQEQFTFDRDKAVEYRDRQQAAREARESEERRARVEELLQKRRDEQDGDVQRSRESFYKLLTTNEYSYPQLDRMLMDSIAILKEAGREDLAALLADDRKMLRERELNRPADTARLEREKLLARIEDLERQLAQVHGGGVPGGNPPPPPVDTVVVHDTGIIPIFVDRPVVINPPLHPGPVPCPPGQSPRPGNGAGRANQPPLPPFVPAQPQRPQLSPQFTPPSAPSAPYPIRPVVQPTPGGAQQQGAHLWRK